MFTLRQASVKMAVLLHKQAKVPFVLSLAVCIVNSVEFEANQTYLQRNTCTSEIIHQAQIQPPLTIFLSPVVHPPETTIA